MYYVLVDSNSNVVAVIENNYRLHENTHKAVKNHLNCTDGGEIEKVEIGGKNIDDNKPVDAHIVGEDEPKEFTLISATFYQ